LKIRSAAGSEAAPERRVWNEFNLMIGKLQMPVRETCSRRRETPCLKSEAVAG
jgi:hypothetical protein